MVQVYAEVDPWDVIDEIDEEDLVEYLKNSGYYVTKGSASQEYEPLTKLEILFLQSKLNTSDWEERRIYEKLLAMRG